MITAGQVYESCDPRDNGRKIQILAYSPGAERAQIISHPDGKRQRQIKASELHTKQVTESGKLRRRGYALIKEA
jgi:hypothetical protein